MARLDVFVGPPGSEAPFVLDVQAELLWSLTSRVVVPLVPADRFKAAMSGLNPVFDIGEVRLLMLTQAIGAVPRRHLRVYVASLRDAHDTVTRALDVLLLGF